MCCGFWLCLCFPLFASMPDLCVGMFNINILADEFKDLTWELVTDLELVIFDSFVMLSLRPT